MSLLVVHCNQGLLSLNLFNLNLNCTVLLGCEDTRFSCNGHGDSIMERNAGIFSANENGPRANYQKQEG